MADQPTLQLGDEGEWVTYLQQCLAAWQPTSSVPETGSYDEQTQGLVQYFQYTASLPENGVCDEATWAALLEKLQAGAEEAEAEGEEGAAGDGATSEPTPMEVALELRPNGTIVVTGTAPVKMKAKSQTFAGWTNFGDGSEHSGAYADFPTRDLEAGEADTVEMDFAYGTVDHGDGENNRLSVQHVFVAIWELPFDIVGGECVSSGEWSYRPDT